MNRSEIRDEANTGESTCIKNHYDHYSNVNILFYFCSIASFLFQLTLFVISALQWCSLTLCTGQGLSLPWYVMGVHGVGLTSREAIDGIHFFHCRKMKLLLCQVHNMCKAEFTFGICYEKKCSIHTVYLQVSLSPSLYSSQSPQIVTR